MASAEHMYLHVDALSGRAGPASDAVLARVERIAAAQSALPQPRPRRASHRASERHVSGPPLGFTFDFNGTLSDDEPIMYAVFAELFADSAGHFRKPTTGII